MAMARGNASLSKSSRQDITEIVWAHQHFVHVEVGCVASLIAPWGGVQGGADIQFVGECLAYSAPDPEKWSLCYQNVGMIRGIMGYLSSDPVPTTPSLLYSFSIV